MIQSSWFNNIKPCCFLSTQLSNYNGTPWLCLDKASCWFSIESLFSSFAPLRFKGGIIFMCIWWWSNGGTIFFTGSQWGPEYYACACGFLYGSIKAPFLWPSSLCLFQLFMSEKCRPKSLSISIWWKPDYPLRAMGEMYGWIGTIIPPRASSPGQCILM